MDSVNMILFEKENVNKIIELLDLQVNGEFIVDEDGEKVTCAACGKEVTKSNLGNVMAGSKTFFCDNPACFATYVAEKKI